MKRLIFAASFVLPALFAFARIVVKDLRARAGLCCALALLTASAWAQTPSPQQPLPSLSPLSPLDARLRKVMADPKATAAAIVAAKKVTFFCEVCHGLEGNSVKGDVPNLGGQNPSYLLTQIDLFSRGLRHYQFMEGLMKLLTEDDRINATIFYASKTINPPETKPPKPAESCTPRAVQRATGPRRAATRIRRVWQDSRANTCDYPSRAIATTAANASLSR